MMLVLFYLLFLPLSYADDGHWRCGQCSCYKNYADCNARSLHTVPSGLPQGTTVLYLEQNRIETIDDQMLRALSGYSFTDLLLTENSIRSVPAAFFRSQPRLQTLKLDANLLEELELPGEDEPHEQLRSLSLQKCGLTQLPPGLCAAFPNLETLNLAGNLISALDRVGNCSNLRNLVLTDNKIGSISGDAMSHLGSLESLIVSRNRLRSLNASSSSGLTPFASLRNLNILDVSRNRLETISTGVFKGLDKLSALHLHHNALTSLPAALFYQLHGLQLLDLSWNALPAFVNGSFYGLGNLRTLNMANNRLTQFGNHLPLQYLTSLTALDLSYNLIQVIHPIGGQHPLPLRSLDLSHNRIELIQGPPAALASLNNTVTLDLSHNRLSGSDPTLSFAGMRSLRTLHLSFNPIKKLPDSTLADLTQLHVLSLENTSLASLSQPAMLALTELQSFSLSTANFHCDCSVAWLSAWLREEPPADKTLDITCAYPRALAGRPLLSLPHHTLECSDLSNEPAILTPPTAPARTLLVGDALTLQCVVQTVLNRETLSVQWRRDFQLLEESSLEDGRGRFSVQTSFTSAPAPTSSAADQSQPPTIVTSRLRIEDVRDSDEGEYTCRASNSFSSETSQPPAAVAVHAPPQFTLLPSNMSQRVGADVSVACDATGDPAPDIRFAKSGGGGGGGGGGPFPAAAQRRLQFHRGVYTITRLTAADAGLYACTANNSVHSITHHFAIDVWEMPDFEEPQRTSEQCIAGSNCILSCRSKGNPRPTVAWTRRDGRPITGGQPMGGAGGRVVLVGEQQEMLLVKNVSREDAGEYTCSLRNKIGRVERTIALHVQPSPSPGSSSLTESSWFTVGVILIAIVTSILLTSLLWLCLVFFYSGGHSGGKRRRRRHQFGDLHPEGTMRLPDMSADCDSFFTHSKSTPTMETGSSGSSGASSGTFPRTHHVYPCPAADHPAADPTGIPASLTAPQLHMPPGLGRDTLANQRLAAFYNPANHTQPPPPHSEMTISNSEHYLSSNDYRAEHSGTSCSSVSANLNNPMTHGGPPPPMTHGQHPSRCKLTPSPESSETSAGGGGGGGSEHNFAHVRRAPPCRTGTQEKLDSLLKEPMFNNVQPPPDTPSYARHFPSSDNNYQPNVNVLDIVGGGGGAGCHPPPIPSRRTLPRSHKMNRSSSTHQCAADLVHHGGASTTGRGRVKVHQSRDQPPTRDSMKHSRSQTLLAGSHRAVCVIPGDRTPPRPPRNSRPDLAGGGLIGETCSHA